jgi:diguanylate cyclase (GGDEF)-like protein
MVFAGCRTPDGALWFLSGNRLFREQDGQWSQPGIDGMPAMPGTLIAVSCTPDGAVWVAGEQHGAWRLTQAGDRLKAWPLELPAAMRSSSPVSILVDGRGWVWLGTDQGLLVWNGLEWRHVTEESGLIWNDVDQGGLYQGADGSLWVGTSGGVAHLLHPERVFDPVPLAVTVTDIRRGGQSYTGAQSIVLPWSGLPLSLRVSSPVTLNRSEFFFKLWMVGLYADWIENQDGLVVFSHLSPGAYTFKAMACNPSLNACSAVVNVPVTILPPWWRSYWFYGLCGLLFLLLLFVTDRLRARHLRERSRRLEGMVLERTRELEERTRELEASREQLRIQATQDGLTGMLNHVSIMRALAAEMERARREKKTLVMAMVDLDHFKHINDVYGHLAGDDALRSFAAAVRAATRAYDHAGRYGGEEFVLILTEIPLEAVEQRLATLHASISNIEISNGEFHFTVTCSIGATAYTPSQGIRSAESLLAIADQALYAAKEAGRNRLVFRSGHSPEAG